MSTVNRTISKGGRGKCLVCASEHRAAIEIGVVAGTPGRVLAERFSIDHKSIANHGRKHLTQAQRAAILVARRPTEVDPEALAERERSSLLGAMVVQRARLLADADTARTLGDIQTAIRAEAAVGHNLATAAKMVGALVQRVDVNHHHVLLSEDWIKARHAIVSALQPFPDALRAVAAAMQALEADAAKQIAPPKPAHQPAPVVIDAEFVEVTPATIPPCPVPARA